MKERESERLLLTDSEKKQLETIERKRTNEEFQVAFCGHFSAGKSTILNYLLGAELLPTSPIPTSANVIKIKNGPLGLTMKTVSGETKTFRGDIPWERVREWGMNGLDIESLLIEAPLSFLGEHSVLFDTPGVDSTDPTHQAITFEALLSTDFIVYVTDYNHVQSETNLHFLKRLSDEKKPIYLIINQIDKHEESELSFTTFDRSIRQTFRDWGIQLVKLRYTSMKEQSHPFNELAQFERELKAIVYQSKRLLPFAKDRLYQGFYINVARRLHEEKEAALDRIKEDVIRAGFTLAELEEWEKLRKEWDESLDKKNRFVEHLQKEVESILKDVTIFPYTTTELTRQWLESTEANFKVGFLFAKKKTEEERRRRLDRLVEDVNDKLKSQLLFHLQRLFQRQDFSRLSNRSEVETSLRQLDLVIDPEFFRQAVQHGPKSREYVYAFTKERTNAITTTLRRKAYDLIELMSKGMERYWEEERNELREKIATLQSLQAYVAQIEDVEADYARQIARANEKAASFHDARRYEEEIEKTMREDVPNFEVSLQLKRIDLPEQAVIDSEWDAEDETNRERFMEERANEWIDSLKNVLARYEDDERMYEERKVLMERIEKFSNQTFTISLFGAFSAGKSSFANALLGETILPVSPQPTTATVSIVKKSDANHRSKTATVKVKTSEQLQDEVESVAKQLDLDVTFETLSTWERQKTGAKTMWQKTYEDYLFTLKNSLKETNWELGSSFDVTLEQLQRFVADERVACLIDEVTIYYDCPLTEKGIVLIDTPGVNSVHSRHTNVAFQQLRESDAIFYVTYYNHAFSKADQMFIEQIAKVNEKFHTDKLYFIVNAADLARTRYELNGVKKHVYEQLVQCGIDNPRLFPLSSKNGLEGKRRGTVVDPLFQTFEKAFYDQTISELKRLSFRLLKDEVNVYERALKEGLEFVMSEASDKDEKRKALMRKIEAKIAEVRALNPFLLQQKVRQEVNELFVYLRERIRFVLNDRFQEAVNVTTVTGTNKREQQLALLHALRAWRNEGEKFLQQEIRATFVRIELTLEEELADWTRETLESLRRFFPALPSTIESSKGELDIDVTTRFIPLSFEQDVKSLQSLKSFFEEKKVTALKEKLVEKGAEIAAEHIKKMEAVTLERFETLVIERIEEVKRKMEKAIRRELERFDQLLDPSHHEALQKEYEAIRALAQKDLPI